MSMMLKNNSLVLKDVSELNFQVNRVKGHVLICRFNEILKKPASDLGGFFSILTNEIYPECLQSLQTQHGELS